MTSDHSQDGCEHDARDELANDRFAQAARNAHAASLDRLSPRVQAQLAQRRRAAIRQDARPAAARTWPMFALGSAAALTLAIGLFALRNSGDADPTTPTPAQTATTAPTPTPIPAPAPDTATQATPVPAPAPAIAAAETTDDAAIEELLADASLPDELLAAEFDAADADIGFDGLQETPDFYLWLGSQEGQADVTESL